MRQRRCCQRCCQRGHRIDAQTARHGSFDGGWNRHPAEEDGWEEISLALQLPFRSIVDVAVGGLPDDCRLKLFLDGRLIGDGVARLASRTWIDRGSRRLAVQWFGRELPNPSVSVRASQLRSVAELEQEHPELVLAVMKHQNPARFVLCQVFIVSFPAGEQTPVYGIFTVDKSELARNPSGNKVVKQDFLVYETASKAVTYYSGLGKKGDKLHGTIDDFCERFGEPHFDCRPLGGGQWDCGDHHYAATDQRLREEPSFRSAFEDALRRAAKESGVDAALMGL